MSSYTLFPTAVGTCGLVWGPEGIVGVQLPESSPSRTLVRLLRKQGGDASLGEPPPAIQQVIDDIVALLEGKQRDLQHARLDMRQVPELFQRIYSVVRRIPPGQTLSYGEVASRLGETDAQTVGQAMARNPFPIVVPCHRAGTLSLPW